MNQGAADEAPASAPATPSHRRAITKSTIASVLATAVELMLVPLLVHLRVPDWITYASVQFVANAITFVLYKYWAFEAAQLGSMREQYAKQLVIFAGSLLLNTAIPSLLSYRMHVYPLWAFAISQVIVYLGWNYPGNRYWVFRR